MANVRTYNSIADEGIEILTRRGHTVAADIDDPDAILVRSADLHGIEMGPSLRAVARAGAGVNNIPIGRCTERGIAVFNTPGSNANSVKELVIAGLMMSSRRIVESASWVQSLHPGGDDVPKLVEKQKSDFTGPEVAGKTLGVVGLGAIGVMVANAAEALGMEVVGFDPYLSVESAWGLSRTVRRATSIEATVAESDFLTLHAPLTDSTRGLINSELLARARVGIRILNFARGELVDEQSILEAVGSGVVSRYVTDFPTKGLLGVAGILCIPHLGASTPEAEINSAVMAAQQLANYLESGNVRNSVNMPECTMAHTDGDRLVFANRNVPNIIGQVTTILAGAGINISDMLNRHRGELAYNIIDIDGTLAPGSVEAIAAIDGVVMVRAIPAAAVPGATK